jgi:putative membrane protein
MLRDALLHFAHFLCIFALASLLVGELIILSGTLQGDVVERLAAIDRWYGIVAGLVVVTGVLLVFFGAKGAQYYAHSSIFWAKMVLFASVAVLSIVPTLAFLRWKRRRSVDGAIVLDGAEHARVRRLLWIEIGIFIFIPLCASLMANGISNWSY